MITYKSRFLARAEVWYDDRPGVTMPADWIIYYRRSNPVPGAKTRSVYTRVIDLTLSHEQLQANLHKDTAYKIRRARERDRIVCEVCDPCNQAVMDRFEEMYNVFAGMKGLSPLHRPRLENMAAAGVLDISVAKDPQGHALLYHANYRDHQRATSMELPSLYRKLADSAERNLIGRANRLLIWSDILRYKEQGLNWFDFGGWYLGDDPAMLKINDFKRGFGGKVVREYECEQIRTLKGWLVLRAASLLERVKLLASPRPEPPPRLQSNLVHDQMPAPTD